MARATAKKATLAPGGYIGKEKLTIARRANGTQVYVWHGQAVPSDIPEAELLRLAEGGYIEAKPTTDKARTSNRSAGGAPGAAGDKGTSTAAGSAGTTESKAKDPAAAAGSEGKTESTGDDDA